MEEIRGPAGRTMWDKLGNVNEAVLANYLKNEYPQTVAVVLSKIKSDHAGRVLAAAARETSRWSASCACCAWSPCSARSWTRVEQTLRTEFMSNLARTSKRDSHEMMAEIFNTFDRQTEARFVAALEERNREAAERIKALMFIFEDLQGSIRAACRPCCARSRRTSWRWRSRARPTRCKRDVLLQHVGARRPRSCATTWRRSARSG